MLGTSHVNEHRDIVEKCQGCIRIYKTIHGKRICGCHCFPHTKWWFGDCPQATHVERKPYEDPIKEP